MATQGTRRPDETLPFDLKPSEYCKRNGNWWVCVPGEPTQGGGRITGNEDDRPNWEVTEHEDGTITVSPSIQLTAKVDGVEQELYHGHLVEGVWNP
jgi:hypothetical protein